MGNKRKDKWNRVDVQVCIYTAILVLIASGMIFMIGYRTTYDGMIRSLENRSESIYHYVEQDLDKSTFYEIEDYGGRENPSYKSMKEKLENVKAATGVRYLYTAKKTDSGDLIYIVDGLSYDSPNFRNPGDPIEHEIWGEMEMALQDRIVYPDDIKHTGWGDIFVCYYPVHDGNEVVGVLGIEFDAHSQYHTYKTLRITAPFIVLLICLVSAAVSVKIFKRISNPLYKDFANTDYLTGLKNRNSFEVDITNLGSRLREQSMAIICMDLNNLKEINDTYGHTVGDDYIRRAASAISFAVEKFHSAYRIGGDEFVILLTGPASQVPDMVRAILAKIHSCLDQDNQKNEIQLSIATGSAQYDPARDKTLTDVYRRADKLMYETKKAMKSVQE